MPWEQGVRVTLGKRLLLLHEGIYLKLPLIHTIFLQEKRLRVINLPIQTVSSKDGHALTISCSVGYSINDIVKLYNTLYQPDMTIGNIIASKVAEYITSNRLSDCTTRGIEDAIDFSIKGTDYGLKYEYIKVINFASVKTFRLIQDQSYMYEGVDLLKTK
jgi:regulator of protease activity HflC (stomatin/prohibitin superfamily)